MSADNFLGIYKVNSRKYLGYNCWSECEQGCRDCDKTPIFTAKTLSEAMNKAQKELGQGIYEYGIHLLNDV